MDCTSLTLLARVQADEPAAWERFVELYAPLVHHWCRRADLPPDCTADVFQDVFQSVAQHIRAFRRDRPGDTLRGWLRTITANKVRDHFRRRADEPAAQGGTTARLVLQAVADPLAAEGLGEDPEETEVMRGIAHQALEWIRGDFEPSTWQAFWQTQIEEQSPADVAKSLNMTPAAVRKAKYRVLQRLREELEGLMPGEGE
jgi:RNA polymerase sigma-70 factor (ECF subfamily)